MKPPIAAHGNADDGRLAGVTLAIPGRDSYNNRFSDKLGRKTRITMAHTVSHQWLLTFATDVFQAVGAPKTEAAIVADHLVTASLMGFDTHGVVRIPQYVEEVEKGMIRPG